VVVWWPENAPEDPHKDLLGRLAARRITDAAATDDPTATLALRARTYAPGDTDLSWTRITPWRSVLAAALDQRHSPIVSAVVEGEAYNPSTELLALWLADRLRAPVERRGSEGPGLTAVHLETAEGTICLDRADGALAVLAMPGQPDRHVALHRRGTSELIAEELRRLDPDEAYASAIGFGATRLGRAVIDPRGEAAGGPCGDGESSEDGGESPAGPGPSGGRGSSGGGEAAVGDEAADGDVPTRWAAAT
jgi:glucose-6-phosphate dehydrogenase assembly protein OpcA